MAAGVDVLQAQAPSQERVAARCRSRRRRRRERAARQQIGAPIQSKFLVPHAIPQPPIPPGSVDSLVAIADVNAAPTSSAAHEAVWPRNYTRKGWNVELCSVNPSRPTSATSFPRRARWPSSNRSIRNAPPVSSRADARPCRAARSGSGRFGAVSTFSLPIVDYNARHSERVNDDAQLASAKTNAGPNPPQGRSTFAKLSRREDRGSPALPRASRSHGRHGSRTHRRTAVQAPA